VTVHSPPTAGNFTTNSAAVEVIITQTGTNWFSGFLPAGYAAPTVGARGVAMANPSLDCLLSLNNTSTAGINFDLLLGNVNMPKCSIGDNSKGSNALEISGFLTSVTAYSATVYGGINSGFFNAFNFTRTPTQNKNTITPDPYVCPGRECRAIPTLPAPVALTPSALPIPGSCSPGTKITGNTTPAAGSCYKGISVASGTVTITTAASAAYKIISPTSPPGPAISVTGGTLNIANGGNFTIIGGANQPAINVTGGTVNFGPGTNIVQGGTTQPAINIAGGTVTFAAGAGTSSFFQGGTTKPGIQVSGVTPSLTINAATNSVLAGVGTSAAITVNGTANTSPYTRLSFGNSNNTVQGAASDHGAHPAMTINGFGHVVFGNGNTAFGGHTVTANVPAVVDQAGFLAGSGQGLVLGSGTFQFMEGISVNGGDLTLNPPGTSGGTGYYIMDGGGSTSSNNGTIGSGFNMTFGDLVGSNVTIALTGGASGGVGATDFANINFNGGNGMTLTAPTAAGTWNTTGVAIFQDPAATPLGGGNANTIYGINFDNITGAIYTPSQPLSFQGLTVMNAQCTQMIAYTITIWGLAFINDDCQGVGVAPIGGNGSIILVE